MRPAFLLAALALAQTGPPPSRTLRPAEPIRQALSGGGSAVFSFIVPADTAARVVVKQESIDVALTLRREGSASPQQNLDFCSGLDCEELSYPAISEVPVAWTLRVEAAISKGPQGYYTISLETKPADDQARAVALARKEYEDVSEIASPGGAAAAQHARTGYPAVAEMALAAGDTALAAEATYQGARAFDLGGDTPGAIEGQRRALELFRQVGRVDREARALNRLGDLSRKVGDVFEAERYFQEALPKARAAADPEAIADILNNSGLLKISLGRFEEAIADMESAIPIAQSVDSASVEGALVNNVAEAYRRLGLYEKAIAGLKRGVEVLGRLNSPRRSGRSLHQLSYAYFESGDRVRAEETMTRALSALEKSGDQAYIADALGLFARMQVASGETDLAEAALSRAAPLLRAAHQRPGEADLLIAWAELELERGDVDAALPKVDEALALTRVTADQQREARGLYVRARALQLKGLLQEAAASISDAIDLVESRRSSIVSSELRTSYLSRVGTYYDLYIELLQQKGDSAAGFAISERARARTLLEGLAQSASRIAKGVDPELLGRRRRVQADLNAKSAYLAQVSLANGEKHPRTLAVGHQVESLLDEWKDVESRIRASSPSWSALQSPGPINLERVQKTLLDEGSVLVEYHLGEKHSYAWVVDRHSISVHEMPPSAKVSEIALAYHERLSRDTEALSVRARQALTKESADLGRRLAKIVWDPVEARVGGKRLILVADGALQYVPFAALPGLDGQPLIMRHEIVALPSASVLDTLRRGSRRLAPGAIAVFADPVFTRDDPRVDVAAAPSRGPEPPGPQSGGRAGGTATFERLRFSRQEAAAIVAAAGNRTFEAVDFFAAKKTLVGQDLRKYRVLHFATHGVLDTEHPELSGLVLSLVEKSGRPIDGFLRLHEIYNLDLDADLVVLSACRTALGKEIHGEGLIGLTRGFMYAGASRVISSVWNVDDRASARLMSKFYEAMLARGLAPATALREAQLSLLAEPRWSNPHYWAAFGLQGEWK